jgi:hypothetical protein
MSFKKGDKIIFSITSFAGRSKEAYADSGKIATVMRDSRDGYVVVKFKHSEMALGYYENSCAQMTFPVKYFKRCALSKQLHFQFK